MTPSHEQFNEFVGCMNNISVALKYLGGGDNGSQMGAVEFLATQNREGASEIADAIRTLAESVSDVAGAIAGSKVGGP